MHIQGIKLRLKGIIEDYNYEVEGLDGMAPYKIREEIKNGARFYMFDSVKSFVIVSFVHPTDIQFIKSDASKLKTGLIQSMRSMIFGWWSLPWGPIFTIATIIKNINGGHDVTDAVLEEFPYFSPDFEDLHQTS